MSRSETRRELVRIAWAARRRALRATDVLPRCQAWQEHYSARIRAKGLPRRLEEVQA